MHTNRKYRLCFKCKKNRRGDSKTYECAYAIIQLIILNKILLIVMLRVF